MKPSLRIIKTYQGHFPLCFHDGILFSRCGFKIFRWDNLESAPQKADGINVSLLQRMTGSIRPLERLFRLGLSHLAISPRQDELAVVNKCVFWKSADGSDWRKIGSLRNVGRPMRFDVCSYGDNEFLIGEYFSNPLRRKVSLWLVDDSGNMKTIFTFPDHTIRHIHSVQEDPFTHQIWITTGDYGPECKILASDDGCRIFSLIGEGDQSWRTCRILFAENAVLWGMDSPSERSYIIRWDRSSQQRDVVAELPGPIWHGTSNARGWYTFATSVEPSPILKEPKAYLWTSPNGLNFHPVAAFEKDDWPWTYFQFGLIYFPIGVAPADYIVFSGNALKRYDNIMVIARIVD